MSPWLVATAVALLLIAPSALAQTVTDLAVGMPPQESPRPAATPAPDPAMLQKLESIRQLVAQRDQIQRQIDQLIVETQTPQRMTVHFELLEVNHSVAAKLGIMPTGRQLTGSLGNRQTWTPADLEKLRQEGAVQTLISPRIQVASGEQATSQFGVVPADGNQDSIDSPFTELRMRADSLGNNQVQVDFRIERATPLEGKKTSNGPIPRTQHAIVDSRLTSKFGESQSFGGMISERTRTRRGALGRVTETIMVETVLLVRVDAEMPRTAGVIPTTTIAPR